MSSLLNVTSLSVDLPGAGRVVDGVSLAVEPGEVLGIVGESGAGKSVLARSLLGLTQRDGSVTAEALEIDGRDMRRAGQRAWRRARGSEAGLVLQDALQSLDPLRTTAAEVGETLQILRIPRRERRERVLEALRGAGLPDAQSLLAKRSGELSGGMRQRVLIASAIVGGARLIVADEPTTALDATVAARILDLLRALADEGAAVVFITHDLAAVRRIADRVAVMEGGRVVEQGSAAQILDAPTHPTARALLEAIPRGAKPFRDEPGERLVSGRGLVRRYGSTIAVDAVDIDVHAGETVGVVGESGSGKSTLARLVIGAEPADAGSVERSARRMRLVPQDPLGSFDPRHTVRKILTLSQRDGGGAPEELMARVGLDAALLDRLPSRLSGGQRQRVAIARALAARPDVLVCDEPVSALDVTTQAGILELLLDLQRREHLAMVFISHDLAVVRRVSDRVIVMKNGRVVETGPTERVYADPQDPFTRELISAG